MQTRQHIARTTAKHAAVAVMMFGFGFAMVPLYDIFCEVTGLNGKIQESVVQTPMEVDTSRNIKVQLVSANNAQMPWRFMALQNEVELHPGQWKQVGFWVSNVTETDMVSQSVPSITPARAAQYVQKSECFCFQQQALKAGESKQMNLVFTISPDLPDDIHTVSMVYTLFDATAFADPQQVVTAAN